MTTKALSRTNAEITAELHALNNLLTNRTIRIIEEERDDLDSIDSIRAQIAVIAQGMSYSTMLAEYDGSGYVVGAAYDAYCWLYEGAASPSSRWRTTVEVFESTTVAAAVVRCLGGKPASSLHPVK